MSQKRFEEYSEEELKYLQRKEALSDSEEYGEISEETYNSPLTRQFVEDDKIVNKPKLKENKDETSPEIVDDIDTEETEESIPPKADSVIQQEPAEADTIRSGSYQDTAQSDQPSAKPKGFENDTLISEKERDYCDRESTLKAVDEPELSPPQEVKQKSSKAGRKPVGPLAAIAVAVLLTLILSFLLFISITNFVTDNQKVNVEKESYITLAETIGTVISQENLIAADIQRSTENFVLGLSDLDAYKSSIGSLDAEIDNEIRRLSDISTSGVSTGNIKIAALDYLKNTQSIIKKIELSFARTEDEVKEHVLYELNDTFQNRDVLYTNLTNLLEAEAQNLDIKVAFDDTKMMFDIEKDYK